MTKKFKKILTTIPALALIFGVGVFTVPAYAASTLHVDGASGSDSATCGPVGDPCQTITQAVTNAAAGDTIQVAAGTYNEEVTISKSLTIKGAQAGFDGASWSGAETVITALSGNNRMFIVNASDVTLDGLKFDGAAGSGAFAVFVSNSNSQNLHATNSVFVNTKNGLKFYQSDASGFTATHNLFKNNDPDGIYVGGPTTHGSNITIANNTFANNSQYGIFIRGDASTPLTDVTIKNNTAVGGDYFVDVYNAKNVVISGNTATDNTAAAVRVGHDPTSGGVTGLMISSNTFSDSPIGVVFYSGDPSTDVTIDSNTITNMSTAAVVFEDGSISGDIAVTNNTMQNNAMKIQNNSDTEVTATNNNADPDADGVDTPSGVEAPTSVDTGVGGYADDNSLLMTLAAIGALLALTVSYLGRHKLAHAFVKTK